MSDDAPNQYELAPVTVPPAPGLHAELNGTPTTTLWFKGTPAQVPTDEIAKFQAMGFIRYQASDLPALSDEAEQLARSVAIATAEFVLSVVQDGVISPEEQATLAVLQKAMSRLNASLQNIIDVAFAVFPVSEAPETPEAQAERIAQDAEYHNLSVEQMRARYGLVEADVAPERMEMT